MVGLTVVSEVSANGLWIFNLNVFHGNNFFLLSALKSHFEQ